MSLRAAFPVVKSRHITLIQNHELDDRRVRRDGARAMNNFFRALLKTRVSRSVLELVVLVI